MSAARIRLPFQTLLYERDKCVRARVGGKGRGGGVGGGALLDEQKTESEHKKQAGCHRCEYSLAAPATSSQSSGGDGEDGRAAGQC